MAAPTKTNPISKVIALILVSTGTVWLMTAADASALAKIDSMSPGNYIEYQRGLHHHSFVFRFIGVLVLGGFYVGAVDFITYVIGFILPKKPDA